MTDIDTAPDRGTTDAIRDKLWRRDVVQRGLAHGLAAAVLGAVVGALPAWPRFG